MAQILIVEDDPYISDMLNTALTKEGYGVLRAFSGTEAQLLLEKHTPDLVLLDLMLPGIRGEELLPKICHIPTIVVSAKLGLDSKVDALLGGAADYITKPFELKELLARIWVRLRSPVNDRQVFSFDDLRLDAATRDVTVGETPIHVTPTEFAVLHHLMLNRGNTVSKSAILEAISYWTEDCTESSLKIHISNLRKKIRQVNGKDMIEAVWGIGFRLKA